MRHISCRRWAAILSVVGAMMPFPGHADERKQLAFDTVERNATQMTLSIDSMIYFGELRMKEVECSKLL